ncbi:MAG: hypothetical protein KKB90_09720 [Actinobacteria bacterium]|nr:hypothetical protein [Actinomycetota bacterium]MCG2820130.1 hypothetical protein [Actinomycetes bacterium]MBU4219221.1 hypothetical protein [Actinomycetota bacterium]MBU4359064.1 hypothetical protein [Actinomycetota bacterium]MBU4392925.1 hypothetical protein [Actinomycetota bacterium]
MGSLRKTTDRGEEAVAAIVIVEPDGVSEKVGQEIDKQLMRFSELLLVLSSGTIAAVVVFFTSVEKKNLLTVGIIFLGLSIFIGLLSLVFYLLALSWNYYYRLDQGKKGEDKEACRCKQECYKCLLRIALGLQSVLFLAGECLLFVFIRVR